VVDVRDDGDVTDGLRCSAHWREILSYEMAVSSRACVRFTSGPARKEGNLLSLSQMGWGGVSGVAGK
jgi:hypothetical protein